MQLSKGYWQTYKEIPSDAEIPSHQLMLRSGMMLKTYAGLYTLLPIGLRVIQKIEKIVREEHNKAGFFELLPPFVTPGELWKESGRWDVMTEMLKAKDKLDRDICLSPTNEESVADTFRRTVNSYKQLPVTLYQINTKYRDEIRPRYGLMRCREFIMKDAYSFHMDKDSLNEVYDVFYKVYSTIFKRMGLEFIPVEADAGAMAGGEAKTHEFQVIAEHGEDKLIHCSQCGYAANVEKAECNRELNIPTTSDAKEKISTPGNATIEAVAKQLGLPESVCLKALVYAGVKGESEEFVLIFTYGDDSLNEIKLKNYLNVDHVRPATEAEMEGFGLVKGFIGPFDIKGDIKILFDRAIDLDGAYVCGAQETDYHYKNVVPTRDLATIKTADLRMAKAGDSCSNCQSKVQEKKGIEVGHIFQLGDKYTKAMSIGVLDQNGKSVTPLMGCYGIGITRTAAAAIEQNHDENGIIWPKAIAPYHIYFAIIGKSDEFLEKASGVYQDLVEKGFEVLFDDRKIGPGVKFKDADLLGLPIRIVMGERDFNKDQTIELKVRKTGECTKVAFAELAKTIQDKLDELV